MGLVNPISSSRIFQRGEGIRVGLVLVLHLIILPVGISCVFYHLSIYTRKKFTWNLKMPLKGKGNIYSDSANGQPLNFWGLHLVGKVKFKLSLQGPLAK